MITERLNSLQWNYGYLMTGAYRFYKDFKKEDTPKLGLYEFVRVIRDYHSLVQDRILLGEKITLPAGMGDIAINSFDPKTAYEQDERFAVRKTDGTKRKRQLKKTTYHNDYGDLSSFKFLWFGNTEGSWPLRKLFSFYPDRAMVKRFQALLKGEAKDDPIADRFDYSRFEIYTTNSKKMTQRKWKRLLQ